MDFDINSCRQVRELHMDHCPMSRKLEASEFNFRIRDIEINTFESGLWTPYCEGKNYLNASDRLQMQTVALNQYEALRGRIPNYISKYGPPRSMTEEINGQLVNYHPNYQDLIRERDDALGFVG